MIRLRPTLPHHQGKDIVNVGSGLGVSVSELLSIMEDVVGVKATVRRSAEPALRRRTQRPLHRPATVADPKLAPMGLRLTLD